MDTSACISAAGMSFFGAWSLSACLVFALLTKKSRDYAREMLSAPETRVSRAMATILSKSKEVMVAGDNAVMYYFLEVEFIARHTDGSTYKVTSAKRVGRKAFLELGAAQHVEVLFPVNEERSFDVITNFNEKQSLFVQGVATIAVSAFASAGIAFVALSVYIYECWLGIPICLVFLLAVVAVLNFFWWPRLRRQRTSNPSAVVTPVDPASPPMPDVEAKDPNRTSNLSAIVSPVDQASPPMPDVVEAKDLNDDAV